VGIKVVSAVANAVVSALAIGNRWLYVNRIVARK